MVNFVHAASALMGMDVMGSAYAHAIEKEYRFYSYGDGSAAALITPQQTGMAETRGLAPATSIHSFWLIIGKYLLSNRSGPL